MPNCDTSVLTAERPDTDRVRLSGLSTREREVLGMIADGLSTKEIASRLFISHKTVESHRYNIVTKTGLAGIARLTKFAIRCGLATVDR